MKAAMKRRKIRFIRSIILSFMLVFTLAAPSWALSYTPGSYTGQGQGYGGTIPVTTKVGEDGKILSIEIGDNQETSDKLEEAKAVIQSIIEKQSTDVDTVSGATRSSQGIIDAVNDSLQRAGTAVYVDGEKGDDTNDGKSAETAVKTFNKAKDVLGDNAGIIYVLGTINVTEDSEWSLPSGTRLERGEGFNGDLATVGENSTLTLKGITIDGGKEKLSEDQIVTGSIVRVAEGGTLNIQEGAVLRNNNTTANGGGVFTAGTVNMKGGEIRDNTITSQNGAGAGISTNATGTIYLSGGKIAYNTAAVTGGGIAVQKNMPYDSSTPKLIMSGGEISHNTAATGAGVYLWFGSIKMEGGEIKSNSAVGELEENTQAGGGGGISSFMGTGILSKGKIEDNMANQQAGISGAFRSLDLSGELSIKGNTVKGVNSNVCSKFTISGAMGSQSRVGVSFADGTEFASGSDYTLTQFDGSVFFSDDPACTVALTEDNKLVLRSDASSDLLQEVYLNGVSGDNSNDGTTPEKAVKTFGQAKSLLAENGTIYVTDMVTVSGEETWSLSDKGNAVVMRHESYAGEEPGDEHDHDYINGPIVEVNGFRAKLTLSDIIIDGNRDNVSSVAGLVVVKNGSLTMEDGTILRSEDCTNHNGGALYIYSGATATMKGGMISNNHSVGFGGGVFNNGTFNLQGGMIMFNSAGYNAGGINNNGIMTMQGLIRISNNTLITAESTTPSDLYFASGKFATLTGTVSGLIKVDSYAKPANIVRSNGDYSITADDIGVFVLDDTTGKYQIEGDEGTINITLTASEEEGSIYLDPENGSDENNGLSAKTPFKTLNKAVSAAKESDAIIYLMNPIVITDEEAVTTDNVMIKRYFSFLEEMVKVSEGSNVTFENICLDGSREEGVAANKSILIIEKDASAILSDGVKIQNNSSVTEGGGIRNAGTLQMKAGIISGNETQDGFDGGGGIYNAAGAILALSGGLIEKNSGYCGAGVENEGTLTMTDGIISENTARGGGGGVHIFGQGTGATMTMKGGTIENNTSTEYSGGGIFSWHGKIQLEGGKIIQNTSLEEGAGVYAMSAVSVKGNVIIEKNTLTSGISSDMTAMRLTQTDELFNEAVISLIDTGAVCTGSEYTITEEDASHYFSDKGYRVYLEESTVYIADSGVSVKETLTMKNGETAELEAKAIHEAEDFDETLTYSSDHPEIASVDATGKVNAKKEGTAVITVTNSAGESADCTIVVEAAASGGGGSSLNDNPTEDTTDSHDGDCPSKAFYDLDTSLWYHEGTDYVIGKGIMKGVGENTFAPDSKMTRAMIVTILFRSEGEPVAADSRFTDVDADSWYGPAVDWAAENGIVKGMSESIFNPNADITREQLATILTRYAEYKGVATGTAEADLSGFSDLRKVSDWALDSMEWCVFANLIKGVTETTLEPQGTATRAQVAVLMQRMGGLN